VATITVDLKERLQLFHDSASCAPYEISNILAILFESAAERKCRKLSGQYFTPRYVAKKSISLLELKRNEIIMDPGCGTGIFPLEILRTFANSATVDCASLTYLGVESDPILALSTAISL
jgi:predicted TPR repeat methyltransferase